MLVNPVPSPTMPHIIDCGLAYTILSRKLTTIPFVRVKLLANLPNLFLGKFAVVIGLTNRFIIAQYINAVQLVFALSNILKVAQSIITGIPVAMVDFIFPLRHRTNKGKQHKLMNQPASFMTGLAKCYSLVPLGARIRLEITPLVEYAASITCCFGGAKTSDMTLIANLVKPFVPRNVLPFFKHTNSQKTTPRYGARVLRQTKHNGVLNINYIKLFNSSNSLVCRASIIPQTGGLCPQ